MYKTKNRGFAAVFLLLTLAVGLFMVYGRYRALLDPPRAGGEARATVTYTLRADSEAKLRTLAEARTLTLEADGTHLGDAVGLPEITPDKIEVTEDDGTVRLIDSPTAYRLKGRFSAEGRYGTYGFFLPDGKHLAVNDSMNVKIGGLNATILILKIEVFSS